MTCTAQGGDGTAEPSHGTPAPSKAKGIPESSFISWQESQPEQPQGTRRDNRATPGLEITPSLESPFPSAELLSHVKLSPGEANPSG